MLALHFDDLPFQFCLHFSSTVEHHRLGQVCAQHLVVAIDLIVPRRSIFPLALLVTGHVLYAFVLNPTVMGLRF